MSVRWAPGWPGIRGPCCLGGLASDESSRLSVDVDLPSLRDVVPAGDRSREEAGASGACEDVRRDAPWVAWAGCRASADDACRLGAAVGSG